MWRKDAFGWGFSFALGAAILAVLLFLSWQVLEAVLGIATPFFVGIAIAVLLDPLVNRIQKQWGGGRRLPAVAIVFVGFLAVFGGLLAFVIPNLITQTQSLVKWFTPITYTVKRKTSDDGPYATVVSTIAATDYLVKNLVNGSFYTFAVFAVDDSGTTKMVGKPIKVTPISEADSREAGSEPALETTTTTTAPASAPENAPDSAGVPQPTQPSPSASARAASPTLTPSPSPTPSPVESDEPTLDSSAAGEVRPPRRERRRVVLPRPRLSIGPVDDKSGSVCVPLPLNPPGPDEPTPSPSTNDATGDSLVSLNYFGSSQGSSRAYAQETESSPTPSASPTPSPTPSASASVKSPSASPAPGLVNKATTIIVRPGAAPAAGKKKPKKASVKLSDAAVAATTLSATVGDGVIHLRWKAPTTDVSGIDSLRAQVDKWLSGHQKIGPFALPKNFEAITTQYGDQMTQGMKAYASHIGEIVVSSVSRLLTVILVPIVIFYVLADIDRLRGRFFFLLPEKMRESFQRGAEDVGNVFGSYVRGMLLVSLAYGVTAMVVFAYWLKSYSLLLGVAAGILYIVPFIGPMVTALLAGVLSLISGLSPAATLGMLALCLAQNQIFDNLVVPRVVGNSVGLHPLLTLFALFLGGEMFGLWGMLLSVPIAASIQVTLFRLFPKLTAPTPLAMLLGKDRPARKPETPEMKDDIPSASAE